VRHDHARRDGFRLTDGIESKLASERDRVRAVRCAGELFDVQGAVRLDHQPRIVHVRRRPIEVNRRGEVRFVGAQSARLAVLMMDGGSAVARGKSDLLVLLR
jgi:hypothetical protein